MGIAEATATVALAVVAIVALLLSSSSAGEAYRSRIDATAQRVVVGELFFYDGVWTKPDKGDPQRVQPGIDWNIRQYGAFLLTLRAGVTIRNEGNVTVFLRVNDPSITTTFESLANNESMAMSSRGISIQDDWGLIPPGYTCFVLIEWTRSSSDWWHDHDVGSGRIWIPTHAFNIEMRDATGNALDICRCEFGESFMGENPTSGVCVILPPLNPSEVRQQIAKVGRILRTYPFESYWYHPISRLKRWRKTENTQTQG